MKKLLLIALLIVGCVFAENNSTIYLANDIIIQCDKLSDSTELKLKELMKSLEETGCSSEEKIKPRGFFYIQSYPIIPPRWER